MRRPETFDIVPDASRTIESLRDVGYELNQAVADLIDNSISAGAENISVQFQHDAAESWIRIADDGTGMDARQITEALRYGATREYTEDDLGKFGFGLKSASTAMCRRVVVASRVAPERARIETRVLDLDHIARTNRWEVVAMPPADRPERLTAPLRNTTGTVVLWEKLDRVLNYRDPYGGWAKRHVLGLLESLDQHLSMVFHRFLAKEVAGGRGLRITVNGNELRPWDPFCRDEAGTQELTTEFLSVHAAATSQIVRVRPFVLPDRANFSSTESFNAAAGPNKWNRQQGLYIYRADRLIQWGGWSRLRTIDEHTKFARIAVDFRPALDPAFRINISKAFVTIPSEIRDELKDISTRTAAAAQSAYRRKPPPPQRPPTASLSSPAPNVSNPATSTNSNATHSLHSPPPAPFQRFERLDAVASALTQAAVRTGDLDALDRIKHDLTNNDPEVAHELGW